MMSDTIKERIHLVEKCLSGPIDKIPAWHKKTDCRYPSAKANTEDYREWICYTLRNSLIACREELRSIREDLDEPRAITLSPTFVTDTHRVGEFHE